MEIIARGPVFTVSLNGVRTVTNAYDARHANGPIALQHGTGGIKFRNLQITPL